MEPVELLYKNFARQILWRMEPDKSHSIGQKIYEKSEILLRLLQNYLYVDDPRLRTEIFGRQLSDSLILAAGWDKDGDITRAMIYSGFRNIILGSVKPYFDAGNNRPWFDRKAEGAEFYNSPGLPSKGKEYVAGKVKEWWPQWRDRVTLFISYAGNSVEQILEVDRALNNLCHMREVDASCPNTSDGKFFEQNPEILKETINALNAQRKMPTFIKISPDYVPDKESELANLVKICLDTNTGIDSANTRVQYNERLKRNAGLSGPQLYESTKKQVKFIYRLTEEEIPLIGTGGIESGKQAQEIIGYGCNGLGTVSSLFTRGFTAKRNIILELLEYLKKGPYHSVEELRGKLLT